MNRARRSSRSRSGRIGVLLTLTLFLGCSQRDRIGGYLETAGKILDDYGSVSVSSPLFADSSLVERGDFSFGLNKSADDYYKNAKTEVQGAVSAFVEHAREINAGLKVRANLQDFLTNRMLYDGYKADLDAYNRKTMFGDAGQLLGLLLPLVDPGLRSIQPRSPKPPPPPNPGH
ncbi:MAG: hypothetical protein IPK83_08110 [Planctomycetes bacterium]|nr:hypothetical protein [Planctomycetota bacterium]